MFCSHCIVWKFADDMPMFNDLASLVGIGPIVRRLTDVLDLSVKAESCI